MSFAENENLGDIHAASFEPLTHQNKIMENTNRNTKEFQKVLKHRVHNHFNFNQANMKSTGKSYLKYMFLILSFVGLYISLFSVIQTPLTLWLCCLTMGLLMAAIGLNISHQAMHGNISHRKNVNRFMGYTFNMLGMSDYIWHIKHDVFHHSYTNDFENDEALKEGDALRLSPDAPHKWFHRYQHYYAFVVYALFTIFWAFALDMEKLNRYNRNGHPTKKQGHDFSQLLKFWLTKVLYIFAFIFLPLSFLSITFGQWLIGFLTMHIIASLIITHVLQVEHLFTGVANPSAEEQSWMSNQIQGTSNFKTKNPILQWLVGGSNYQIEHHAFPYISADHFKEIQPILIQTAAEYHITYYEHPGFWIAVKEHYKYLKLCNYSGTTRIQNP